MQAGLFAQLVVVPLFTRHRILSQVAGYELPVLKGLPPLVLTEEDGKATMPCTVLYASKETRDAALGTGMKEGWSASYDRLDKYLRRMA